MILRIEMCEFESPGDSGHCWIASVVDGDHHIYDCEARSKAAAIRTAKAWIKRMQQAQVVVCET